MAFFVVVFGCTLMVKTYCKRLAVYVEEVKIAHACTHTTYKNYGEKEPQEQTCDLLH